MAYRDDGWSTDARRKSLRKEISRLKKKQKESLIVATRGEKNYYQRLFSSITK